MREIENVLYVSVFAVDDKALEELIGQGLRSWDVAEGVPKAINPGIDVTCEQLSSNPQVLALGVSALKILGLNKNEIDSEIESTHVHTSRSMSR